MTQSWQYDVFGGMTAINAAGTIANNLRKLLRENSKFLSGFSNDLTWAYLQTFHGVSDAISRTQYFELPAIDSLRRIYSNVRKEFNK